MKIIQMQMIQYASLMMDVQIKPISAIDIMHRRPWKSIFHGNPTDKTAH
jgi:hypothetical protein